MSAARSMRFAICSVALVAFCLFLWPRPASADVYYAVHFACTSSTGVGCSSAPTLSTPNVNFPDPVFGVTAAGYTPLPAGPVAYAGALITDPWTWDFLYVAGMHPYWALTINNNGTDAMSGEWDFAVPPTTNVPQEWSGTISYSQVAAAPEPSTLSLLFVGLMGLGLLAGVKRYRGNRLQAQA